MMREANTRSEYLGTYNKACDRCGSEQTIALFQNKDYISGEAFTVQGCAQCGLARTAFPYDTSTLERYYGEAYYGDEGRRFVGVMEWMVGRFRAGRVDTVLRFHRSGSPGSILDVGCGRGLMLASLKARGWSCAGTEVSDQLAARLRERGIAVYAAANLADCHLPAESFDVITLWHSLEHVAHPAQTTREVSRLLKPGGVMIVETPNLASWQAAVGGGRWFHLDTPRHLYHFSADTLRGMLADAGLKPIRVSTLSLEQGIYGMVQTLLNRVTREPNVLYSLLKKRRPRGEGLQWLWDIGATAALLPLAAPAGTALECLSALFGRGAVIRIVAEKRQ